MRFCKEQETNICTIDTLYALHRQHLAQARVDFWYTMPFTCFEPFANENLKTNMDPSPKVLNEDTLDMMNKPQDSPVGGKGSEIKEI